MSLRGLDANFALRRSDHFELELALSVAPGETVALLGPNGAGKSTAMAAIAGLIPIDSGRIALDGHPLDDPASGVFVESDHRHVGVVFQDYLLFRHLSCLENVAFGLRSRGVSRGEASRRSRECLDDLGLEDVHQVRPPHLSGGQAQRVALARALVTEPELLLLDEPLSSLDVTTRSSLRRTLREHLSAFPGPRLLITHDPAEAFSLADRIHVIEEGRVTQTGTADDIRLRPVTSYAADLGGTNLLVGKAVAGSVRVGGHTLHVADEVADGPVLVSIPLTAISAHIRRPDGSPRNTWATQVCEVERLGPRVRLRTGEPLPLTVELTEAARAELGLEPASEIWVAVKATEIGVQSEEVID